MVRLNTRISLHLDADREVVRMTCGDHLIYYRDEVASARQIFNAPLPEEADVVVSNAYLNDLSLTFARKKGITSLRYCASGVSRIAIAAWSEGVGHDGFFPFLNRPRFYRQRQIDRRLSVMKPREITRKIGLRLYHGLRVKFIENPYLQKREKERSLVANSQTQSGGSKAEESILGPLLPVCSSAVSRSIGGAHSRSSKVCSPKSVLRCSAPPPEPNPKRSEWAACQDPDFIMTGSARR